MPQKHLRPDVFLGPCSLHLKRFPCPVLGKRANGKGRGHAGAIEQSFRIDLPLRKLAPDRLEPTADFWWNKANFICTPEPEFLVLIIQKAREWLCRYREHINEVSIWEVSEKCRNATMRLYRGDQLYGRDDNRG